MLTSLSADPEVVVSMRYFQDEGVSHASIYLYKEEGKLLRRLTEAKGVDDVNPFFSPDGSVIVFTRYNGNDKSTWSIEPLGRNLTKLSDTPDWYENVLAIGHETNSDLFLKPNQTRVSDLIEKADDDSSESYRIPGGGSVVLKGNQDMTSTVTIVDSNKSVHKIHCDNSSGSACTLWGDDNQHILFQPENHLKLLFTNYHLDSTDGNQTSAIDLNDFTVHPLISHGHYVPSGTVENGTPGSVSPIPIPGEPAFLSWTDIRFVSYGTQGKTDYSSYLERWDSSFHQTNYSHPGGGQFYGGSLYRGDHQPNVIWVIWKNPPDRPVIDPKGLAF